MESAYVYFEVVESPERVSSLSALRTVREDLPSHGSVQLLDVPCAWGLCVMVDLGNGLPFPNSVAVGIAFEALDDELASGGFDVDGDPSSVEGLVATQVAVKPLQSRPRSPALLLP